MSLHTTRRRGFTLVELLVAMSLAVVLLGLAVAVTQTGAFESYRTTGSADKLSQYLIAAKARAARDRQIRGVRILIDPGLGGKSARQCQYIEVPEPWRATNDGQSCMIQQVIDEADPAPKSLDQKRILTTRVFLAGVNVGDFELDGTSSTSALVRVNDTLMLPEVSGRGFRIIGITNPASSLPTLIPGRTSAAYPVQFHTPQLNNGTLPYPASLLTSMCPAPSTAVIELQLADMTSFAPGYSKFVMWNANQTVPKFPPGSPVYPQNFADTGLPNPLGNFPVELPFGGSNIGTFNNAPYSLDMNPLNFVKGSSNPVNAMVPVLTTRNFAIQRAPRPLLGEPNLPLPKNMIVDFAPTPNANNLYVNNYSPDLSTMGSGYVDILFTPNGEVIGAPNAVICLLVRDVEKAQSVDLTNVDMYDGAGQMAMVVIQAKTGMISTKGVVSPSTNADPFMLAKSGVNAGL